MMHENTMQDHEGERTDDRAGAIGSGNRPDNARSTGKRGFFNELDGGGAGGGQMATFREHHQGGAPEAPRGQHAGRGPKGYRRSDARITEHVHEVLTADDSLDASDIEVSVSNGEVTLTGTVSSKQAKRHATELVDELHGVEQVYNRLRVAETDRGGAGEM